jgi:hypothetical protein
LDRLRRNPESVEELVHGKGPADPGEMLAVLQQTQKNRPRCTRRRCHQQPRRKERIRAQIFKEL